MHLSRHLVALRYAMAIALAIYLGGQVKKPDRFAGRFFARLMNGYMDLNIIRAASAPCIIPNIIIFV